MIFKIFNYAGIAAGIVLVGIGIKASFMEGAFVLPSRKAYSEGQGQGLLIFLGFALTGYCLFNLLYSKKSK